MSTELGFDFCKILQKYSLVFLILLCVVVSQLDVTDDTSNINGIKITPSCPDAAEKWKKQAEIWNCESIMTTVNVQLKYHCLLNHWKNETLEFCGEEKDIIGQTCPEFNQRGNRIQASWNHKCNESDPPCPFKYKSSEVFKYPACLNPETTIVDDDVHNIKKESDVINEFPITEITVIVFLTILFISLIYLYFKGKTTNPQD